MNPFVGNSLLVLHLPIPPTVNHHWTAITIKGKPRRIVSRAGNTFRAEVSRYIAQHNVPCCRGPVTVEGLVFFPTRAGDVDNRTKPALDALETAHVFENDRQVMRCDFRRAGSRTKPGCLLIRISSFVEERADDVEWWFERLAQ